MLDDMIGRVFEFAFPLYAVAATRYRAIADLTNPERHAPNTLWHQRQLSDNRSTWITTLNNDTLYPNAWIDLSAGPVRLRLSPMPAGRYWSLEFMDASTDHFDVVGSRTVSAGPVDLTLVGPEHELPALQHVVPNEASVLANWLPAPQGPFQSSLLAYDPGAALRDGLCAMPTLERVISSPR
jgi:hypothetical protein